jgi:hypothetical protein
LRKRSLFATTATAILMAGLLAVPAVAQTTRPVSPQWGDIDAFWGDIDAFWGDIDAFAGTANPFWGDIDAFWGDIDAFQGAANPFWGDIDAFWGDIDAFEGTVGPNWGDIDAFWGQGGSTTGVGKVWGQINTSWSAVDVGSKRTRDAARASLRTQLQDLVNRSDAFWGDSVRAKTGKSFWDGFAADVFTRHGLNLNDTSTFNGFTGVERTRFFFDWYDGLMEFSGRDHVDWWMDVSRWTPKVTQIQGSGSNTVIGLIDFSLRDGDLTNNQSAWIWNGYDNPMGGHGGAVASLLVAAHDGKGVMGIAPKARIAAHNPFDATGTASWDDISMGVSNVFVQGARVVNLSLGVPGMTLHGDWNSFYSRWNIAALKGATVYVHAAGNDGLAQTTNINWNFANDPSLIVVGSVGPSGQISSFSNTPGTACLLDQGVCNDSNRLMNRFLVAPGEWILVSDNAGGVTRRSGTSFAAPLVTGAVALLQDRWGWLKQYPRETVDIILGSARDLGAPGVDPVYGRGLLDITASQSPLNFGALYQLTPDANGVLQKIYITPTSTKDTVWATGSGYLTALEDIGRTYRDFVIPVDNVLASTTSSTTLSAQTYLTDSFAAWSDGSATTSTTSSPTTTTTTTTSTSKTSRKALTSDGFAVANPWGWDVRARHFALPLAQQTQDSALTSASEVQIRSLNGGAVSFGNGVGAMSLAGDAAAAPGRFDPEQGGLNPMLGLASGGAYAKAEIPLPGGLNLTAGATGRRFENLLRDPASGELRPVHETVNPYRAMATQVALSRPVGNGVSVTAGYVQLREQDGVLGVQSTNPVHFQDGAVTDAVSLGATWSATDRLSFSGSATLGRTRAQSTRDQAMAVAGEGVDSSAFEAAVDVRRIFGRNDRARIALVQPMHVEAGGFNITEVEVADRSTGALGQATRFAPIDGQARELALEAMYATPILEGRGEIAGFVRGEAAMADGLRGSTEDLVGGSLTFRF